MEFRSLTLKQRIESHIRSKDGCWLTDYSCKPGQRPSISIGGKRYRLARVVYEVYKNESPGELCVCHTCDNILCVNPEHLWLGTIADNNIDKVKKNRQLKGTQISNSKLTEHQVQEIKQLLIVGELNSRQIGDSFGVSASVIKKIKCQERWNHVTFDGLDKIKPSAHNRKLNCDDAIQIKTMLVQGISRAEIADLFGISRHTVGAIARGELWKTVVAGID